VGVAGAAPLTGADALPGEEAEVDEPCAAACEAAALGAEPGTADPELDAGAPPVPVVGEEAAAEAGAPV